MFINDCCVYTTKMNADTLKGDSKTPTFKPRIDLYDFPDMNKDELIYAIEQELDKVDKEGIKELKQFLRDTDFYTAPASSKHHLCRYAGLAQHSLNTMVILKHFNDVFNLLTEEEVIIIGLLHDICKVGCYQVNELKSGKISDAKPYVYEDPSPLGHGEKSVMILQEFIRLTDKEGLCIRWHMGALGFDDWERSSPMIKKAGYLKEVTMTFLADHMATMVVEE